MRFPLEVVERIVRAVAITPLPGASANVLGVINVHGEVLPVLNLRRRLGFPERELEPDDEFILVRQRGRLAALIADRVEDVTELFSEARVDLALAAPADGFTAGVLKLRGGLALVQDLEKIPLTRRAGAPRRGPFSP